MKRSAFKIIVQLSNFSKLDIFISFSHFGWFLPYDYLGNCFILINQVNQILILINFHVFHLIKLRRKKVHRGNCWQGSTNFWVTRRTRTRRQHFWWWQPPGESRPPQRSWQVSPSPPPDWTGRAPVDTWTRVLWHLGKRGLPHQPSNILSNTVLVLLVDHHHTHLHCHPW